MPRYLTKSRFKLALQCPTKLYYTGKAEYYNANKDDTFLQSLAEGGFQVGELAKCYHPGGTEIQSTNHDEALKQTADLLKTPNTTIYEAAFNYQNTFIRADIIIKQGREVELIEVKAKSYNPNTDTFLNSKTKAPAAAWKEYLYDLAFQTYVLEHAHPDLTITPSLLLANKTATATVSALNQKFLLVKDEHNQTKVKINGDTSLPALGDPILIKVNLRPVIDQIKTQSIQVASHTYTFEEFIHLAAKHYAQDQKINSPIGTWCGKCEFRNHNHTPTQQSGFHQCLNAQLNLTDSELNQPLIFDLWQCRNKQTLIDQRKLLLKDLTPIDIEFDPSQTPPNPTKTRQWLQIKKVKDQDNTPYIDKTKIAQHLSKHHYPLHFIDFETSNAAIPFHRGMSPYETIAFQFSHHQITATGTITHQGQFLCAQPGIFPNFAFIRALKQELQNDNGSIFRYAAHENTCLTKIKTQLQNSNSSDTPDKEELIEFIDHITHSTNNDPQQTSGERDMIDLLQIVKDTLYLPQTNGSNSIKEILPAILNASPYLQNKYSKPIYGKACTIKSLNLDHHTWINKDQNGNIISPYKTLPPVTENLTYDQAESLATTEIADGGAALIAYARLQFTQISPTERQQTEQALLGYCELDTLAMVMLYEYLQQQLIN
ncbi:MAG: DUF2779 domain-containing protein [Deltaproteobacteria bacterium]|nr:DUF2779 domain-containing protein [Deltaproteobacteria bacterium]